MTVLGTRVSQGLQAFQDADDQLVGLCDVAICRAFGLIEVQYSVIRRWGSTKTCGRHQQPLSQEDEDKL